MSNQTDQANLKTLRTALLVVVGMFGFAYVLVQIYWFACEQFGFNGQGQKISTERANTFKVDKTRTIKVVFDSNVHPKLPWKFHPKSSSMEVHPGEVKKVLYFAKNISSRDITGQATYRVSPPEAARFFKKNDCFCFDQQKLVKGEGKDMTVLFVIDPRISKDIKIVYLSYTFLDAGKYAKK